MLFSLHSRTVRRILTVSGVLVALAASASVHRVKPGHRILKMNNEGSQVLAPGFHVIPIGTARAMDLPLVHQLTQHKVMGFAPDGPQSCTFTMAIRPSSEQPEMVFADTGKHYLVLTLPKALHKSSELFLKQKSEDLYPLSDENPAVVEFRAQLEKELIQNLRPYFMELTSLHIDHIEHPDYFLDNRIMNLLQTKGPVETRNIINKEKEQISNYLTRNRAERFRLLTDDFVQASKEATWYDKVFTPPVEWGVADY